MDMTVVKEGTKSLGGLSLLSHKGLSIYKWHEVEGKN